ncbi:MAG: hypothetical protein U0324_34875 [Polyangiales bacterium]
MGRLLLLATGAILTGCLTTLDPCGRASPGASLECPVEGEFDRAFSLRVPARWDGTAALPVIVAFHGGGGNRRSAESVTCPTGTPGEPGCLSAVALAAGYVVVFPDGTGLRPLRNVRSWNAGGGRDGWQCVSRGACQSGVDDVAFFDRLLAAVEKSVPVDRRRVFVTGLSNGGAVSHRLACERPGVVAAFAAVGGTNQFAVAGGRCDARVPVMQIHGVDDPCWGYETRTSTCAFLEEGRKVGVDETLAGWRARNGCGADARDEALADAAADGTRVTRRTWQGCAAPVVHLRVEGGGHTWPGGHQYLDVDTVGRVSRDVNASEEIVRFFDANPRR